MWDQSVIKALLALLVAAPGVHTSPMCARDAATVASKAVSIILLAHPLEHIPFTSLWNNLHDQSSISPPLLDLHAPTCGNEC